MTLIHVPYCNNHGISSHDDSNLTYAEPFLLSVFGFIYLSNQYPNCPASDFFSPFLKRAPLSASDIADEKETTVSPTNLSHLVFGLVGSEKAWHHRKAYIESWSPNVTRGLLFLDNAPTPGLLPWSPASPSYRISDDLTTFLNKTDVTPQRIIHAIMEVYREDHENMRWLMGRRFDTVPG
ncbi:UNVERIFIED_CONTAM: hypothetical protein Slati_0545500 [Sesamum latifolium]|uniref:Uncharacterized protein n=1 Tax=Sesamum latifolium TaxID=2727402 RepID=A0AAW2XZD6_9LAMI